MSKTIAGLLLLTLVLGCKQETTQTTTSATATTETTTTTVTTTTTTAAATSSTSSVPECEAYFAAVAKYLQCKKVPQQLRDAQADAERNMRSTFAGWENLPEPARTPAKENARAGCTAALDSLKTAAKASECPIE